MKKIFRIKKELNIICFFMLLTMLAGAFIKPVSASSIPDTRQLPRLVDDADVLSESEEAELLAKLDQISEKHNLDVVVNTIKGGNYTSITQYADDYFDYNGFGTETAGGILLVMDYGGRDWAISTYGTGIQIFTDAGQEYMTSSFLPFLSDGKAYEGFSKYAELCDDYAREYSEKGKAYDVNHKPAWKAEAEAKKNMPKRVGIAAVAALVIALIVVSSLTAQLKTVRAVHDADNYIVPGSFKLNRAQDFFLYRTVSRTERQSSSGSSGGSSSHTSSSGRSHGGSSGKF